MGAGSSGGNSHRTQCFSPEYQALIAATCAAGPWRELRGSREGLVLESGQSWSSGQILSPTSEKGSQPGGSRTGPVGGPDPRPALSLWPRPGVEPRSQGTRCPSLGAWLSLSKGSFFSEACLTGGAPGDWVRANPRERCSGMKHSWCFWTSRRTGLCSHVASNPLRRLPVLGPRGRPAGEGLSGFL